MDKRKIKEIIDFYSETLDFLGIGPIENIHKSALFLKKERKLSHCYWMLNKIQAFDSVNKAMRWLGFIQGVFWSEDVFSIDQLKNHNRSENKT